MESIINGLSVLAYAINNEYKSLGKVASASFSLTSTNSGDYVFQPAPIVDNGTVTVTPSGTWVGDTVYLPQGTITVPNGWVNGGTYYPPNPNCDSGYQPSGVSAGPIPSGLTNEQILELAEQIKKSKIIITEDKLKKAAAIELKREPTQEELDDIRRQIRDRIINDEREL